MNATEPPVPSPWHRNVYGQWTRCLSDGSRLKVFRSCGRWYWSRCDGTTARYSPGFCHRRGRPLLVAAVAGRAGLLGALVELMGDGLVGRLVGVGLLAAEVHCWSRRPDGGLLVEVHHLAAEDFDER